MMYYSKIKLNDSLAEALSKGLLNKKETGAVEAPAAIEVIEEEFEILEENLGNLDFVNKKLLPAFLNYNKKLSAGVGADSEIEDIQFKNSGNLEKAIFETDDVVGFVLAVDDWKNQIVSVSRANAFSYYKTGGGKEWATLAAKNSFKYNAKGDVKFKFDNQGFEAYLKSKGLTTAPEVTKAAYAASSSISSIKKFLNELIVFARKTGLSLGAKLIKLDRVRAQKRLDRFNARAGAIATLDSKDLAKTLKAELKGRLEAFKNAKVSDKAMSKEEIQALLTKSFPQKFEYNGLIFNFDRSYNVDNAIQAKITKEKNHWEAYLQYSLSNSEDSKRYDMRSELKKAMEAEFGEANDEFYQAYADAMTEKLPRSIKAYVEVSDSFALIVTKVELSGY